MDITTALRRANIDFKTLVNNSHEIKICCPFCPENGQTIDTRYRLGVNAETGLAHCYNCGFKSRDFFWVLQKRFGFIVERSLAVAAKVRVPASVEYPFSSSLISDDPKHSKKAMKYLLDRGVTKTQITRYAMRYCWSGRYKERIILPVTHAGKLHCFIARHLKRTHPIRYLNEGPRGVFNLDKVAKNNHVFVAEGIFKALAVERAIGRACISFLGSKVSPEQIAHVKEVAGLNIKFFVIPDPDPDGLSAMDKLCPLLHDLGTVYLPKECPTKQIDEYEDGDIATILDRWMLATPARTLGLLLEASNRRKEEVWRA